MRMFLLALFLASTLVCCSRTGTADKGEEPSHKSEAGVVEMGLEAQKHVGMRVAAASLTQLQEYLQVTGTVQPIDSRIGQVRPMARGRIQEVLAKVGDRVRTGQALARFDNVEAGELAAQYHAAQAELQRLKVHMTTATRQVERSGRLVEIGAVSQREFEVAQAEQRSLQEAIKAQESVIAGLEARLRRFGVNTGDPRNPSVTVIPAPFAGVVIKAGVAPGAVVDVASELFQIAHLSQVWVQAEVYEKDLGRIRLGQTAAIRVDTYPEENFTGKVSYIGDILDPTTRTAKVRCEVPNPGTRLKLDMFATVYLPTTFSRTAIAVPTAAIQEVEGKKVVFVGKADTKFEMRPIQAGREIDGKTEVVAGLREGEPVVVNGAFHLKSILLGKELGEKE